MKQNNLHVAIFRTRTWTIVRVSKCCRCLSTLQSCWTQTIKLVVVQIFTTCHVIVSCWRNDVQNKQTIVCWNIKKMKHNYLYWINFSLKIMKPSTCHDIDINFVLNRTNLNKKTIKQIYFDKRSCFYSVSMLRQTRRNEINDVVCVAKLTFDRV